MKVLIILLSTLFTTSLLASGQFNIKERIETRNFFLEVYPSVFGKKEFAIESEFLEKVEKLKRRPKKRVVKMIENLDKIFPSNITRPIIYWRYIEPNDQKVSDVLSFYMIYKLLTLRDHIDDPLSVDKNDALNILRSISEFNNANSQNIFGVTKSSITEKAKIMSRFQNDRSFSQALKQTSLISLDLKSPLPSITPYCLSYFGIIPGNQVKLISENQRDMGRIRWLNERVIFNGGVLDFDAPHIKMPLRNEDTGHVVFKQDPIYQKVRDMILKAKESVFIDIFLFGGTLGATLSEFLLDQTIIKKKKNPNFKVLMLHDYATNYNMKDEMMPIFEYIKKRVENEKELKDSVFLLQANIQRHTPGIPFRITNLIPKTPEVFKEIEKRNTYYESKIDHSKVTVIDANTDSPEAYFGSKNWSDHSGAYYYDDAIWIKGPAAAMVQASYYKDVEAALTEDPQELSWFFYKDQGFDNKAYLPRKKEILDWFKIKRESYPYHGYEKVRMAEANVDGKIKNVRNILIDMIKKAEKNIYMEQLFIYDRFIVDALIKRKIQRADLDIKILADHNGNFGLNGLPNTIFIKEMKRYGIEVRARKTFGITAKFPNGHEQEYHQENHRKISSVDGKILLGGSSNLNPDTLQGSFREFGAQIWSKSEISRFESDFLRDWNDPEKTMDLDIENFQAKVGGKLLPIPLSSLLNDLGASLLRSKEKLEKRF